MALTNFVTGEATGMESTTPCAACGALVGAEELAQGLAVRVSGRLLCPLCLEHLPGDAKVLVNQMRALRGMAVTTFRYYSGRHPRLPLFTFTTAALVLAHRRRLAHGESFETPPLPPPGSRPRMPSAAEAARGERTGWFTVAGVLILVATGIVWLVLPSGSPPPAATPTPTVPIAPVAVPNAPVLPEAPVHHQANELTALGRRLRSHPLEAQAIAEAAELLRDGLAPQDITLRNRADSLVREAQALVEAQRPPPPAPQPELPIPAPQPAPQPEPQPEPVTALPPQPILPPATPTPPLVVPDPVTTPPVTTPVKPDKTAKPAKPIDAVACTVVVAWPKSGKPLVEPAGLPRSKDLPWPWPTGVAIHVPAMDGKSKPKHLAIELRLAGVSTGGGATVVVHPGKAERTQLHATWTDGTNTVGPLAIELGGLRWQSLAIPATGCEAIDQAQLRLRLEDVRDLGDQRPFLIAGASTRSVGTPMPSDHPPGLPLLLPQDLLEKANGWSTFRVALRQLTQKRVDDRLFAFAKAKVLVPFRSRGGLFRTALRDDLAALQGLAHLANGNPDDLLSGQADFPNPQAGWPVDGMGDLADYQTLAFGWRALAWGAEQDRRSRLEALLGKMLTADKRLRRPAVVPVLLLGDIDRASPDERAAIDQHWLEHALYFAGRGVPVIDLRSAQAEASTEQVQRTAAALLVDGLRQLDWLLKL